MPLEFPRNCPRSPASCLRCRWFAAAAGTGLICSISYLLLIVAVGVGARKDCELDRHRFVVAALSWFGLLVFVAAVLRHEWKHADPLVVLVQRLVGISVGFVFGVAGAIGTNAVVLMVADGLV